MNLIKIYESFLISDRVKKACTHIIKKLSKELDRDLYYHNVSHTIQIMNSVKMLCEMENVDDEKSNLLLVAAAYHDAGFLIRYRNNEECGAEIALEDLPKFGFSNEQIRLIATYILATDHNFIATTTEEKIMKDADLSYVGTPEYKEQSDELRKEWSLKKRSYSDDEWLDIQIGFLESHKFLTPSAIKLWESKKKDNLKILQLHRS